MQPEDSYTSLDKLSLDNLIETLNMSHDAVYKLCDEFKLFEEAKQYAVIGCIIDKLNDSMFCFAEDIITKSASEGIKQFLAALWKKRQHYNRKSVLLPFRWKGFLSQSASEQYNAEYELDF